MHRPQLVALRKSAFRSELLGSTRSSQTEWHGQRLAEDSAGLSLERSRCRLW